MLFIADSNHKTPQYIYFNCLNVSKLLWIKRIELITKQNLHMQHHCILLSMNK